MHSYFITTIKNEALDVNAHNEDEQIIIKHPCEEKWAVKVLPENKYVKLRLKGIVVDSLTDDWIR